jgi:hypothetical protein
MGVLPLQEGLPYTAAGIYTGGVLPKGYDAVIMLEDTDRNASLLEVRRSLQESENVLLQGEEYAPGDVVLKEGTRIDYRTVGLLATLGIVLYRARCFGLVSSVRVTRSFLRKLLLLPLGLFGMPTAGCCRHFFGNTVFPFPISELCATMSLLSAMPWRRDWSNARFFSSVEAPR